MRGSFTAGLVAVALAGGLTACSDKTFGKALPQEPTWSTTSGTGGPFTTGPTRTSSSSEPGAAASPVKNMEPCSLLSAAETADLRAGQGRAQNVNNARACLFENAEGFSMQIAIYDELGLDDITAHSTITPVPTVGKHNAVQWTGGIRTCAISLEVTKTSRVDTQGTAGTDMQKSCEIALRVAKLVEPRVPQ